MKKILFFLFFLCGNIFSISGNEKKPLTDGPYVFYKDNSVQVYNFDASGEISINTFSLNSLNKLKVSSEDNKYCFDVQLHPIYRETSKIPAPDKIFVISDPHGNLTAFINILQQGGVIDNSLSWNFGKNHLVILGDVADRGRDVTAIYWLIYKLENEALLGGGKVHFILGNHEAMLLQNDLRYTNSKYITTATALSMSLPKLYGPDTELGRWFRSKNTIQIIGNTLFVHGGISREFAEKYKDFSVVNQLVSNSLGKAKHNMNEEEIFLFSMKGPLWYRGLIYKENKYFPTTKEDVDIIIDTYKVARIVIGHTTLNNITITYSGKVIAIDCESKQYKHLSRGLLINGNNVIIVKNK
jgi:hypothetical protein